MKRRIEYQVWTKYGFIPHVCKSVRHARRVAKALAVDRILRVTTITEVVRETEVR